MSTKKLRNPALLIILSILGVLALSIAAGLLLMQRQEISSGDLRTLLLSREEVPSTQEFDPISWAREGAAYPPLQEAEDIGGEFVIDYNGAGAIPGEPEPKAAAGIDSPASPVPVPAPAPVPASIEEPGYREVTEDAFWVQVFSSTDASRAEDVRENLAGRGLPSTIQTREVAGILRYRVRLGAFEGEGEAELYADTVRRLPGFQSSYVVIAPVTRRIPSGG